MTPTNGGLGSKLLQFQRKKIPALIASELPIKKLFPIHCKIALDSRNSFSQLVMKPGSNASAGWPQKAPREEGVRTAGSNISRVASRETSSCFWKKPERNLQRVMTALQILPLFWLWREMSPSLNTHLRCQAVSWKPFEGICEIIEALITVFFLHFQRKPKNKK